MLGFLVKQKLKLARVCEDSVQDRGGRVFQAKEISGAKKAPKERLLDPGAVRGIWEEWTEGVSKKQQVRLEHLLYQRPVSFFDEASESWGKSLSPRIILVPGFNFSEDLA